MLSIAAKNLLTRKSRTFLAVLALVIGVLTIVSLISITDGLRETFTETLSGVTGITVFHKDAIDLPFSKLSKDRVSELEAVPGVRAAIPEVWGSVTQIDGDKAVGGGLSFGFVTLLGMDAVQETKRNGLPFGVTLVEGREFTTQDVDVAIIGQDIADEYKKGVGGIIEVDGKKLKIVGIFAAGQIAGSTIAVPMSVAQNLVGLPLDTVNSFTVEVFDPGRQEQIAQNIEFKFDDLKAETVSEFSDQFNAVIGTLDSFFIIIALVSLIIAGVGIINTMLMSVLERKKEFGVLKAMGWTSRDVLKLIVYESLAIGVIGGAVGIVLSVLLITFLGPAIGFPLAVKPQTLLLAAVFSVLAGLVGGAYPAWKASTLDPVAAMRGEA